MIKEVQIVNQEMDFVKKVENLSMEGDVATNWKRFKRSYEVFEVAAGIATKTNPVKIATFLNAMGQEALDGYMILSS